MDLSLFYFAFTFFRLLSIADPIELANPCPTSRRLLLFGGFNLPILQKKSHSTSSSPPKDARSSDSHGLIVYIRPQTSNELGQKVRSYTHLLKSKLFTNKETARLKRLRIEKKKQSKKTYTRQHQSSSIITKTKELVPIKNDELNRCKALLQTDSPTTKNEKKSRKDEPTIPVKVKNITAQVTKTIKRRAATATTSLPTKEPKIQTTKTTSETNSTKKKSISLADKTNENRPSISPVINHSPTKPSSPPSPSSINTKSKRTKPSTITIIHQADQSFDTTEDEIVEKNNSVVDRAYHFVKTMFQLSDNLLSENHTQEDPIIPPTNEHHHRSRKLLSIDELSFETSDHSSVLLTSISKRQLLSVKTNKRSTSTKMTRNKEKKSKASPYSDANKPKVGWAYRYRISRYLEAQKMKRTGKKNKQTAGSKSKQQSKKTTPTTNTKVSKRKLLQHDSEEHSSWEKDEISDHDFPNTVSITKQFLPKRQLLLNSKTKHKYQDEKANDDVEKSKSRHRKKFSFEELTDPIAIVQSYDRGLYKPRVGWQFRYRVSRYIDSLRENIREDQERLKLGLQAIKRQTPEEISGRRKHVSDKLVTPNPDQSKKQTQTKTNEQESKPNVGWHYRYRVSKMIDAKKRGEFVDGEQRKQPSENSSPIVNESIEGENDLDPELRQINDEGRRVGWAYRYRIRRKLDHLKQQQAETGIPFDLATLSGKREKKALKPKVKATEMKPADLHESKASNKTKSVGWEYRYRVSKMRDAQKHEKSKATSSQKQAQKSVPEQKNPRSAPVTPDEQTVGWKYRYRIRRKLDSKNNATLRQSDVGKRVKKPSSSKHKTDKKLLERVEESIEKIFDIDDIEETVIMKYFRWISSYIFSGLLPTAKNSICLLPLPVKFSFCNGETNTQTITTTKQTPFKKLKTKKEYRAKQFIRSHVTKLGAEDKATERRVDELMKTLYQAPSPPSPQTSSSVAHNVKSSKRKRRRPSKQPQNIHRKKSVRKKIGVDSKRKQNKKQFQIIGQQVKNKQKHFSPPSIVTTPPPVVEVPTTTVSPRLRSIPEVIQEEAATILATKRSTARTPEETQAEINENNESIQEHQKVKVTTTMPPTLIDSTTSGEEDNDSTSSSDNDHKTNRDNQDEKLDL